MSGNKQSRVFVLDRFVLWHSFMRHFLCVLLFWRGVGPEEAKPNRVGGGTSPNEAMSLRQVLGGADAGAGCRRLGLG